MNRNSRELKRLARENLTGHYQTPMAAFVCASAITMALEFAFSMIQNNHPSAIQLATLAVAEFLIGLISAILNVGILDIHLSMARRKTYDLKQLFSGFQNHPDRIIICAFLVTAATLVSAVPMFIGMVLFVLKQTALRAILLAATALLSAVLGLILFFAFQLVFYILLDHPKYSAVTCLKESIRLMNGHKGRCFYITLSFLGMDVLMLLSLGIGSLWIMPYQTQTYTLFYLDILGQVPDKDASGETSSDSTYTFNQYV